MGEGTPGLRNPFWKPLTQAKDLGTGKLAAWVLGTSC